MSKNENKKPYYKLTPEQFEKKFYSQFDKAEYELLTEYESSKKDIRVKHKVCGGVHVAMAYSFINHYKGKMPCKKCAMEKRKQNLQQKLFDKFGDKYILENADITNRKQYITIINKECGHSFKRQIHNFLYNKHHYQHSCPVCRKEKHQNQLIKEIETVENGAYVLLEKFNNFRKKILLKHKVCNTEYKTYPHNFLAGFGRCPNCRKKDMEGN